MIPGGQIGRYRIIRRVGSGGMAMTFLCALDGVGGFQKDVVIKMIDPERLDDQRFLNMFLDEARLWAKFSHPNIPQAFELGTFNGMPYIVMEYVPGPTLHLLSRKIGTRSEYDLWRIARIGAEIARALDYAYYGTTSDGTQLKVVHRDVTLNNILLSTSGRPSLIDFGIALADDRLARTEIGTFKGRVQYMAPEQLLDRTADHRTDLFQLGITMYHLVTGRAAYASESKNPAAMWKARMEGEVTPILTLMPACPPALAALIEQCIQNEPADRPERGSKLADALDAAIAASGRGPIEAKDLAAWVRDLFPNQEWTAATGPSALNTGGSALGTDPSRVVTGASRVITGTGQIPAGTNAVGSMSALQTVSPRGWTAIAATLVGGFGFAGLTIVALSALLIATQLQDDEPAPPPHPPAEVAEQVDPNRAAGVFLDEAERLIQIERYRDAGVFLLKARDAAPTDPELIVRLSRVSSKVEDKLLLTAAEQAFAADDLDTAAARAREILDIQPTHPDALALLARVSEAREAKEEALKEADEPEPAASKEAKPTKGTLNVTSSPPAQVFVDDRPYGAAPLSNLQLPVGTHTVDFRLAGYTPVKRTVTIRGNDKVRLKVSLEAIQQEPEAAASDRLTSLVAAVAPDAEPAQGAAAGSAEAAGAVGPPGAGAAVAAGSADAAAPEPEPAQSAASDVAAAPEPAGTPDAPAEPGGPTAPAEEPQGTAELTSDVAMTKQAVVLARALSFDAKLPGRVGDKLVVAALFTDSATKKRALRMTTEFSSFGARIGGKSLTTTALEFTTGQALSEAIAAQGIDVVYVPSGMGAQLSEVIRATRSANVVTIGAEPSYVRAGLSLGVFNKGGTPVLALNQGAAAAEGAAFGGEILQIAEKMD